MQGGGYWQGQITHFDFKDRFNFKLHVLGTQMTLRAGVSCLHLQDVLIETWAGAQLKAGTGGTEQDFCSAHPRRTKSTNKTQNVMRSQLSTYSFQTEAPINPKTLSKLALSTVKGRPCPARLPGAVAARSRCSSPAPQPSLMYVQILSQAALTHPHHAAMRHRAGRPAKTVI